MPFQLHSVKKLVQKIGVLFARYPKVSFVRPDILAPYFQNPQKTGPAHTLAIETVADGLYFMIFGAVAGRLSQKINLNVHQILTRSINGAIGLGWIASLKRSAPLAWLLNRPWVKASSPYISTVAYRCASWGHPILDLILWFQSAKLWQTIQTSEGRKGLEYDGIEISDLVIDSYLRFKPSPRFEANNPFVRRLIWQAMRDITRAKRYFAKNKPTWYLTTYTTYLEHGIPARVALSMGIHVWSFGNFNSFCKKLSTRDTWHTRNFSEYRSIFQSLDNQSHRIELAKNQLETRLSGAIDLATSYMKNSAYSQKKAELPPGLEGAVVVFLHDFYDSPHVYPELVFDDFWEWITFTILTLNAANIPFFIKPHPNQISLSDKALNELKLIYPELRWLSTDINNVQLAKAGIACGITVYGTVAHELAYLGVPSIGSAKHPHHAFDFCKTAHSKQEYKALLETANKIETCAKEMQTQALQFFYMHNLHGREEELGIRRAFVELWKSCHAELPEKGKALADLQALTSNPCFNELIDEMVKLA